jgi:hypothetical protein
MTTYEKATKVREKSMHFAQQLRSEGNNSEASLFHAMCMCSDEGLAALYDALQSK